MFYLQKESEFSDDCKDIAFAVGSPDFFAARFENEDKINVLIMCIAYKDIESNYIEKDNKIVVRMKIDEKELDHYKSIIKRESIVKLSVRCEKEPGYELSEFILSDIIDTDYKDEDLKKILDEYLEPIYYNDEVLGDFSYNRMIGTFDKELEWINNKKILFSFDDSDDDDKNKACVFLRKLFSNKEDWDKKIRDYSSKKIIKEGNYITEKSGGNSIKEETFIKEFMGKIDFVSVMVHEKDNYVNYRLGNRAIFNVDIIVEGDLNGNLFNAFISSF